MIDGLAASDDPGGGARATARFALARDSDGPRLALALPLVLPPGSPLRLTAEVEAGPCRVVSLGREGDGVRLVVEFPEGDGEDDEAVVGVRDRDGGECVPLRVVVRRTRCRIGSALMGGGRSGVGLRPQARAALLWRAWRRYEEVVALKRFGGGYSGSEVLVVRPRLRARVEEDGDVLGGAWGSCLLVKTGRARDVLREWERSRLYLEDRLHPFLARPEEVLEVRPVGEGPAGVGEATVISSFLGGDLVRAESLEHRIRGASEPETCGRMIGRVFANLAPWHSPGRTLPLKRWQRAFAPPGPEVPGDRPPWLLFGKYDLARPRGEGGLRGRREFSAGLMWDTAFVRGEHLKDHLLGRGDGLLHRLGEVPAKFSLIHGDLNPRNALGSGDDFWLIDFEHTGPGPALADFAHLEANLRLWCLPLRTGGEDVEGAAEAFEAILLDHALGVEGGLEGVRPLAEGCSVPTPTTS